jgi:thiamine kinase-like enzyme
LLQLEARWREATDGESLVHLDIRADNVLLTRDRVLFVDWPAASIGAPWIDLVAMLPSVAMQGGPDPEDIWRAHPLSRGVDDDRVDAFLAGIVGYFAHTVWLPPPPGLPTIRAFQSAQGTHAAAWLAARRGWTDFRL